MVDNTSERVTALFEKAAMTREARLLTDPHDWQKLNDIRKRHEHSRKTTSQDYRNNYNARVDVAKQKIIARAGAKTLDPPTPFGTDRFGKTAIDRQAHKQVQQDHNRKMGGIDKSEAKEMKELLSKAQDRAGPKQSFARAAAPEPQKRSPPTRSR